MLQPEAEWREAFGTPAQQAERYGRLFRWSAKIKVTILRGQQVVDVQEFPNLITTAGLNLVRQCLAAVDSTIRYTALGTSNAAPAVGQTALGGEQFRKAVTSQTLLGDGVIKTVTYIAPGEANGFTTEEIGWFAGASAGAGSGTGVMIARVLYNRAKTALESIQIERTDTFA